MNKTKQFKRTALSKSAKSMVSLMLLLIAMLVPQGAWAANHYDAGYGSWTSTHDADGVKFKITALRMYNYQGNNSQFRSNPEVNILANGKTHTLYLGSLTSNTGKDTFYYNGEGNENPYKGSGSFSKVTYDQTQNDIRVKAYFNNQKNDQKVTTNPDKNYKDNGNGSDKWCTADLTIEIYAHTCTKVTIAGNWGDYSDGINKTESYSWTFNLGHTTTVFQTTPATCVNTGLRTSKCSCGAAIEEVLPIDPNAHSFNEIGICTNGGDVHHWQAPEGQGTAEKPYLVRKYGNLAWLSEQVRTTSNNSFHARQMDDIQCPNSNVESLWLPIGCSTEDGSGNVTQHPFSGTYDGGGFLLKGFGVAYFSTFDYTYNGTIFGVVKNATIKNVGVVSATVINSISDPYSAALCGSAESSTIENCFVVGSDYAFTQSANAPYTAALCGVSKRTNITGCYTSDNYPLIVKDESRTSFDNCYGLNKTIYNTTTSFGFTQINANDVASGALCYTMNGNETNGTQTWYQNLGSEAEGFPRPLKNTAYTVYKISHLKCDGVNPNGKYSYSNSNAKGTVDDHTFTFTTDLLPTCTKAGSKSKQCTVCSAKVEESIDMLSHQMIEHAAKEATCTENGTIKYYTCSRSCCSDKYYKDSGAHTTDVYTTVTQSKKPHTFKSNDTSQSECTVCNHGFFRYASDKNIVVEPRANSLQDAKGNTLEIISNENGVMEFDKPLVIIGENAFWDKNDFVGDLIIPNTVTTIGVSAFARSYGFSGNLIIPNSVKTIGDYAFYETKFSKLTLSNSLTSIGNSAFEMCQNLTGDLILPNTLKIIGDNAFYFCRKLTGNLIIPNSVESIGAYAFRCCGGFTGDLTISNSVKIIREQTFYECSGFAGKLTIPNSVESIENLAFKLLNNLKSIEMQSVPKIVGSDAFRTTNCTKNIVLSDDSYVYTGSNPYFPAVASVTYTRKGIKNLWGTIVVPFKVNGSGKDYDLYTITRVSADKLSLAKVEGTLAAGTPAIICLKDGLAGNYDLTLTAANHAVVNSDGTLQGSSANGLQLVGTYAATQLSANDYFIANNKFWRAGDMSAPVKAAPFRAYLKNTTGSAMASSLNIAVEDDSATAIDVLNVLNDADAEYYDLNGRRIPQLQKGINIVKYGNGKTVKVNIK